MRKGKRIGQGRTAEIFECGHSEILKLYREEIPQEAIDAEYQTGKLLESYQLPVPAIHDRIQFNGRTGIVFEKIEGPTMMKIISYRPWRIQSEARRLAELHKEIQITIDQDFRSQIQKLTNNILQTEFLPIDYKHFLIKLVDKLCTGNTLCHGDFHPDNIILSKKGPVIIDWMTATAGNPLTDVARTSVLLRLGSIPEQKPEWQISLINAARSRFYKEYINHYTRISGTEENKLHQRELIVAASRLVEWIPRNEKEILVEFIKDNINK